MSHPEICSVSEPWILLPLLYPKKQNDLTVDYDKEVCRQALQDFFSELPKKMFSYDKSLKEFVTDIYSSACDNEKYFLDKTPRYYFIIPEIAKLFPEAKFIFLGRNPLATLASVIETWNFGKLNVKPSNTDLYEGPHLLSDGYELLKEKSILIKYEELVEKSSEVTEKICNYLEIPFNSNMIQNIQKEKLHGTMGDPYIAKEKQVQNKSLEKWKTTFNTNLRIQYAKKYLRSLDSEKLSLLGYNIESILSELAKLQPKKQSPQNWLADRYAIYKAGQ